MSSNSAKSAVVLVSGGLDSATVLAIARRDGFQVNAISFDYGQRQRVELNAAKRVCQSIGVASHLVFPLDLRLFGGSALTGEIAVPKDRSDEEIETGIPITYVPARNTIFLALAMGYAESVSARDLFIGVNAVDYSGYPDCRPEFIEAFRRVANLATKSGVEQGGWQIHTPLVHLSKAEIIRLGTELGVDYSLTLSCYDPTEEDLPCGRCDACQLRRKGFAEAELDDPAQS